MFVSGFPLPKKGVAFASKRHLRFSPRTFPGTTSCCAARQPIGLTAVRRGILLFPRECQEKPKVLALLIWACLKKQGQTVGSSLLNLCRLPIWSPPDNESTPILGQTHSDVFWSFTTRGVSVLAIQRLILGAWFGARAVSWRLVPESPNQNSESRRARKC